MKTGGTGVMPIQVIQALEQGSKIEAIKRLRESSGMGLKEAKEAIEAYLDANPVVNVRFQQTTRESGGIFKMIAVSVCLFIALLLVNLTGKNEKIQIAKFFNTDIFGMNEPKDGGMAAINSTRSLFYPRDIDEAVEIYNAYSLQRASIPKDFSYQELMNDPLKIKYLVTKDALKAYEKYLGFNSHKAFAVSEGGNYGYSGSDRIELEYAIEEALAYCKKYMKTYGDGECRIIDINGVFLGKLKNGSSGMSR